jgi:DNA invertase Pin-like site-specific DNA recombinase
MVEFYENQTGKGSCPALIVDSLDRLTRNSQDMATMFKLVSEKALEIHLVGHGQVLSGKSNPSDFFMVDIGCSLHFFASHHRAQQRLHRVSGKCQGSN